MKNFVINTLVFFLSLTGLCFFHSASAEQIGEKQTNVTPINAPNPVFEQKFDWVQTTSGEWLKGDIIVLFEHQLKFDSDQFGIQVIDLDDVAQIRSMNMQSVRMKSGEIITGKVWVNAGRLTVISPEQSVALELSELLSITGLESNESDLWSAKVNLGANLRKGNTEQLDLTFAAQAHRRSAVSRFDIDYVANLSKSKDQDTGQTTESANSDRLKTNYDWFFTHRTFFRLIGFEYFSDELGNIDYRTTLGPGIGYHFYDTKKLTWNIAAGPSYQKTAYINVEAGEKVSENSAVLIISNNIEWEMTDDIDLDLDYQLQRVSKDAGKQIHHLKAAFSFDVIGNIDVDMAFYLDRVDNPKRNENGITPDKDDYRFVVSLGYEF
ncbi:DUF481 domain-containing protein [Colwellia sp. MEBiC06753]